MAVTAGSLTLPGGGPALTSFNGFITSAGQVSLSQNSRAAIYGFSATGSTTFSMTRAASSAVPPLTGDGAEAV